MTTRKQDPATKEFRQDAYASSAEYERGILGNRVAARCQKLTDPEEIAMLWWLQQVSWRDGGIEKFTEQFLVENETMLGTPSMHRFGMKKGQVYNAAQVRKVRSELGAPECMEFPLRDDKRADRLADFLDLPDYEDLTVYPESYPASEFLDVCTGSLRQFSNWLKGMLVDPQSGSLRSGYWSMSGFWDALCKWRDREREVARAAIVETDVTRRVFEELDFAYETRSFVLIEGREGIGKSEAARCWCDQRPGQAIYVRLESGSDETTLYRSIAREIGTACSYQRKAVEMRARIQDALQPGHLMLVLDEAHFLWPTSARSERTTPKRLDWLRTALIDFNVPIALVSTPQFFTQQCDRFRKAGWNSNQIQRRLTRLVRLPESLSKEDVLGVVARNFPEVPLRTAKEIAAVALLSVGYLTTIVSLRKRFDFLSSRRPSTAPADLLREILDEKSAELDLAVQPVEKPVATPTQAICRVRPGAPQGRGNFAPPLIVQPELSVV
ncbi:MAG: ATP-binding protein [Nibricoccus sp.]